MESQTFCAYNQTRECFLGLKVKAGELSSNHVAELMLEGPMKSGEGLWMKPFRGIAATAMPAPLDLIYLDEECRVIDLAESFPTFQVSSSSPRPQSVLALPAHSIYSSQTQSGDQLVLCVAEEMERQLERLTNTREEPVTVPVITGAALLREKPLWSGGPGLLELEERNGHDKPEALQAHSMDLTPPETKTKSQTRNWLQRWWSPDPRKAPRVKEPGLAAYYWNGAAPVAHGLCGDRRAVVSGDSGSDDSAEIRSRRGICGTVNRRAVAGRALGSGRRGAAIYSHRRPRLTSWQDNDDGRGQPGAVRSLP
jgi:uncharacterized membrane protein (UPF0127 family)